MKHLLMGLVTAVAVTTLTTSLQAGIVATYNDFGISGTDPFGHAWSLDSDGWGTPGIGDGNIPWNGPSTITDFHITFDLPQGVEIAPHDGFNGTVFRVDPFSPLPTFDWQTTIIGNTAHFVAQNPNQFLTVGRNFFVNISFTQPVSSVAFEASYTDDLVVPEPSTFTMFAMSGLGFGGVALRRYRRRIA